MNNLAETVWRENPVILGAIAGSGKFRFKSGEHERDLCMCYSENSMVSQDGIEWFTVNKCTLITRSIDSLTFEESCKIPSIQEEAETELRIVSLTDRTMWLNINIKLNRLSALDMFYLLSIGIWTGSKEGVGVVE